MSNKTEKIAVVFLWGLIIVSAILIVSLIVCISGDEHTPAMNSWINVNLIWAYVLIFFGTGVAVFSDLVHVATDLKASKKALTAIGFFAGVILISYLSASNSIPQFLGAEKFINDGTLTAKTAKFIDMGLYATYILFGIAVLSIVFSSATRFFNIPLRK